MKTYGFFMVVVLMIEAVVGAVSSNFTLTLKSDESEIKSFAIVTNGNDIFVGNSSLSGYSSVSGVIQPDGSLKLASDSYIGISKNYLTITSNTTEYASPFKVKDGYLYLYGSKDFKAIPSGESDLWVVGSNSASSTASSVYTIAIKALDSDGKSVSDYDISSSGASSSALSKRSFMASLIVPLALGAW